MCFEEKKADVGKETIPERILNLPRLLYNLTLPYRSVHPTTTQTGPRTVGLGPGGARDQVKLCDREAFSVLP